MEKLYVLVRNSVETPKKISPSPVSKAWGEWNADMLWSTTNEREIQHAA